MKPRFAIRVLLLVCLAGLLPPATTLAQTEIEVTSPTASVMGGKQQIASVPVRSRFVVQQRQGDWQLVTVQTPEGPRQGWIHRKDTRQLFLPPKSPLNATIEIYKEQAERAVAEFDRWHDAEDWQKAAKAGEQLVSLYYRGLGSEDKYAGKAETLLAFCYARAHRDYEAEQFYLHAISVLKNFDDFADELRTAQTALADLYRKQGEYQKADLWSARGLELAESKHGPENRQTAHALAIRGAVLVDSSRYREAESLLQRAQAIYEREQLPELVECMVENLGTLYERMEQLDQALAAHQRALQMKEARLGVEHADLVGTLSLLAGIQEKRGDYQASEANYRRGLRLLAVSSRTDLNTRIDLMRGLGTTLTVAGKAGEAESLLLQAVELEQSVRGHESLGIASILWTLAHLYYTLHQNEKAAQVLKQSMSIYETHVGREHRDFLGAAQMAGIVYKDLGRWEEAEKLLREVIEARQRRHESSWMPQVNLAGVYYESGKLAEAESLFRQAIAQAEKEMGPDHPQLAQSIALLSEVYLVQKEWAKAEPPILQAIHIFEKRLGANHPNLRVPLRDLARVQFVTGRSAEAISTFDRQRRIAHAYLHNILPWFSEREQLEALAHERGPFEMALSLAFERPEEAPIVEHTAEWVLNGKAVAYEVLAQRTLLSRSATTPELAEVVRELEQVRQAMANQALATPSTGNPPAAVLEQLTEREQTLQKRLGQLGGGHAAPARWVELATVRNNIPKDAVLIELAMIHRHDFKGAQRSQSADLRYVAWVIPAAGEGDVRFVELGHENSITEAIQEFRKLSDASAQQILELGEKEAERRMTAALEKVSDLLLRPLEKPIAQKRHWIISPAWYAWGVPWSALSLTKGRYAIEDHVVSYRISGRKLAETAGQQHEPTNTIGAIFADPDFNLEPDENKLPMPMGNEFIASRSAQIAGRVGRNWLRLPGTAEETAATLPQLTTWLGSKPAVFLQQQAREVQFRKLKSPRALVMSTHGYFLSDETEAEPKAEPGDNNELQVDDHRQENALLRCGLVLAGANRRLNASDNQDDGILTGLEILATDLRGTEIVVLSACETAGGVYSAGEGVAGLQQVFQLAGGRTVLATLWSIPDAETAELMTNFWHTMAQKQSKADALRDAQLAIIQSRRRDIGAAHPYFWAAFTLSGAAN